MAAIPINLTIPANKNVNDEALLNFLKVYPNNTADPNDPDYKPPGPPGPPVAGLSDEDWMAEKTRQWLNSIINVGNVRTFAEGKPDFDPDVVET